MTLGAQGVTVSVRDSLGGSEVGELFAKSVHLVTSGASRGFEFGW